MYPFKQYGTSVDELALTQYHSKYGSVVLSPCIVTTKYHEAQHKSWKTLFNTSLLSEWVCSCQKNQEWAVLPSSHLAKCTLLSNIDIASLDFFVTIIYLSIAQLAFPVLKKYNTHLFQLYMKDPQINQILTKNTDLNMHTQKMIFSLWISHMMIDSVSMSTGNSLQTAFKYANVGSTVFCNPQNCLNIKVVSVSGLVPHI